MGALLTKLRAVPAPLAILLAVATALAFAWAILLPPFQGPDENNHFAYTQRMVETRSIPWFPSGVDPSGLSGTSSEVRMAEGLSGEWALIGNVADRANWTSVDEEIWRRGDATLAPNAKEDGGFVVSMRYPPLYYMYTAIPYAVTSSGTVFTREFAMRLSGIPLLLGTVVFAWLIAGELFGRRRALQTVTAGVVALNPQLLHLTTIVNPDAALAFLGSAVIYLAVRMLRRGATRPLAAWMVAACAACGLTHPRGLALAGAGGLLLLYAIWKTTRPHSERAERLVRIGIPTGAVVGTLGLAAVAANFTSLAVMREFASYLWQFYLPKLPFMSTSIGPDYGVKQVYIDRVFGTFGQLDAAMAAQTLDKIAVGATIGVVLVVLALIVQWRSVRPQLDVLLALVFVAALYMLINHVLAFRALRDSPLDPIITGRYLLPLIALSGVAAATVVRAVPQLASRFLQRPLSRMAGAVAASGVLTLCVVLQFAALGVVVVRFYG